MASIARTSGPRPLAVSSLASLRITLIALLLTSFVLDSPQAHETTSDRSKSPDNQSRILSRSPSRQLSPSPSPPNYRRSRSWPPARSCSLDYNFDHLQLTLMWSPGTCSISSHACNRGIPSRFTIHGLWPQGKTSEGPSECCFENTFVIEYLKPLMPALKQWWPSYFSTENKFFWAHEWRKHGTCTKDIPALNGETNYFGTTLSLTKKLRILDTLQKAGIVPSDDKIYNGASIVEALKTVHNNKLVQIVCESERDHPIPVITGLNFCFDKQLNPIDCPGSKGKCSVQSLKFPATVSRFSSAFKPAEKINGIRAWTSAKAWSFK